MSVSQELCLTLSITRAVFDSQTMSVSQALWQELSLWESTCLTQNHKSSSMFSSSKPVIARWPAGAWTLTQTWTLYPDQLVVKVVTAPNSKNNLCGVWILFCPLKTPKLRTAVSRYQPSSPRLMWPHSCCLEYWSSWPRFERIEEILVSSWVNCTLFYGWVVPNPYWSLILLSQCWLCTVCRTGTYSLTYKKMPDSYNHPLLQWNEIISHIIMCLSLLLSSMTTELFCNKLHL